jgi:hypothetical protein
LINFIELGGDDDGDVNLLAFNEVTDVYNKKRMANLLESLKVVKKKKIFRTRKQHPKVDPRTSAWYINYVTDASKTWRDEDSRNGKLFAFRFSFSCQSVQDIVATISLQIISGELLQIMQVLHFLFKSCLLHKYVFHLSLNMYI